MAWYLYQPTTKDFDILRESVKEYASVFKDFSVEKEKKQSIKKQLEENRGKAADVPAAQAKNKKNDLEV